MHHGERVFWVNGRWHRNEWRNHAYPASITFSNGGTYRGGRYDGFTGADRFNARYDSYHRGMRDGRREMNPDRRDDRDRGEMDRQDGRDNMQDERGDDRDDGSDHR
jgi:hypothetical protein